MLKTPQRRSLLGERYLGELASRITDAAESARGTGGATVNVSAVLGELEDVRQAMGIPEPDFTAIADGLRRLKKAADAVTDAERRPVYEYKRQRSSDSHPMIAGRNHLSGILALAHRFRHQRDTTARTGVRVSRRGLPTLVSLVRLGHAGRRASCTRVRRGSHRPTSTRQILNSGPGGRPAARSSMESASRGELSPERNSWDCCIPLLARYEPSKSSFFRNSDLKTCLYSLSLSRALISTA